VLDFEGNQEFGVVEFGIVTLVNLEISGCVGVGCRSKSGTFISRDFREHSRINNEADDEVEFSDHVSKFVLLRRSGIFCAHSSQTEKSLLRSYMPTPGLVLRFYASGLTSSWDPWIDTKLLYRRCFPNIRNYSLMALITRCNLRSALDEVSGKYCPVYKCKPHNALYDALASALLLMNFIKISKITSLVDLVEICL
jgi:DNA polymerase III epsilon subunit-like protein